MNNKILLTILFTLSLSPSAFSKKITLNDLIGNIEHQSINVDITIPKPFINKTQLRLKDKKNQFNKGDIDIEFRLYTDNISEYISKKKLYRNQIARKKILENISRGDQLKNIINYYILLNLSFKKYEMLSSLKTVFKDKVVVLRKLAKKGIAKVTDYLSAIEKQELNQVELKRQNAEVESLVGSINAMLGTKYSKNEFARNEKLISLKFIKDILKTASSKQEGLGVQLAKYERERIQIETDLDSQSENKILQFVSVEINQNQFPSADEYNVNDIDENRLSLNISMNIPFMDSNMGRADKTMDSYLKQRKSKSEYVDSMADYINLKKTVEALVQGVSRLENSKSIKEAKKYIKIYSKRKGSSPLRLLALNEFLIDSDLKANEYRGELYMKFYQYMYELGKLDIINGKLSIKG